ncbi:hypothetical protein Q2T40_13300 [Winogradskyella maritima]|uniref:Anti-sigma factor n=1 Tax=Winogradskyella maritima TaxID=1517766 RepID=A0ABV8AHM0_9FLAO|nr:hypothetical protein [Winogradskyella maritima]
MAQDIRDLFKQEQQNSVSKLSEGHEARFIKKLDDALPKKASRKSGWSFLSIAASVVVLLGLGYGTFQYLNQPIENDTTEIVEAITPEVKTMGDFSPDLKKVEDYYLASINLELSKVELTPENKEVFDGYLMQLEELKTEYHNLNLELTENGANPLTIDALINNLKLRLNLLYRLQEQLKDLQAVDANGESSI